jgi:hypothetical protein
MYPGLSDTDCWIAELYYRQLVDEGLRQQLVTGALPESPSICSVLTSVFTSRRQQLGALLGRADQRLQGVQAVTKESFGPTATGDRGAIA